jgi:hypothetical protein
MRAPSPFSDSSVRPSFLRTTPAKNPRTECCCQPVGAPCHQAAPSGAKTGTQGIVGAKERGRIPRELFEEILDQFSEKRGPAEHPPLDDVADAA